jgi:hypothetical protein
VTPLAQSLALSPEVYPHTLDAVNDAVYAVRLTEADYARASFLDQRALSAQTPGEWVRLDALAAAVEEAGLEEGLGFIFHIGHVGSTLLSRLIGAHPGVLSLREPLPLRVLAQMQLELATAESAWSGEDYDARLGAFLKLWSRRFRPDQLAVVKATSFCSELAAEVLARPGAPRAVLLSVSPETYLATIFAGENNHLDIRGMAANRLRRLHRRIGGEAWRLHALSYGEQVAMSWASETASLAQAQASAGAGALAVDFDRMLAEPEAMLAAVFAHFERAVTDREVAAIASGPDMTRYAKAPEHGYDAGLRTAVLDQARREHAAEIAGGLAWLERAAAAHAVIGDVVGRR